MSETFIRASRLKLWMSRKDCPPAIQECCKVFSKCYGTTDAAEWPANFFHDGGDVSERSLPEEAQVPHDLKNLFSARTIRLHAYHTHNGITYARSSTHLGNSMIEYYSRGDSSTSPLPGCIKYIVTSRKHTTFVVQRLSAPPLGTNDPFRHYPHFPARVYSALIDSALEVVNLDWVVSHVAFWKMTDELSVVVSLSRVSPVSKHVIVLPAHATQE
jgi:hypothetical protein